MNIELEVMPFTGPHNTISKDRAVIQINFLDIKVVEYKTIEKYPQGTT